MTRIDEIKERMRIYHNADEGDPNDIAGAVILVQDNAAEDIEYLLSRLEIADKALEAMNHRASSYTDRESAKMVLNELRENSMKALQQISS